MFEKTPLEIPEQVREMAERNVEQTRAAYQQFMDAARQAQDLVSRSQGAMTEAIVAVQSKAMRFAEDNVAAGFKLAADLARARDVSEYFEIQNRHAQRQMEIYSDQARILGQLMAEAAMRAQTRM
jgi:phasin